MNKNHNFVYNCLRLANKGWSVTDEEVRNQTKLALEELAAGTGESFSEGDLAHLCAGFTPWGDSVEPEIIQAIKKVRVAGLMPYYACKALAALFAICVMLPEYAGAKLGRLVTAKGIRAAVAQACDFGYEPQLVQLISEQFERILDGNLTENHAQIAIIKEAYRLGYHYEKVYRGCAQCTLAAMFDITGKNDDVLFRSANSLAAGMGMFGDGACGGYSGGLLLIGMYAGRRREFFDGDKEEKDKMAELTAKLHQKFIDAYGTVICEKIHGEIFGREFHIRGAQDKEDFELAGAHNLDKCTAVVAQAAAWCAQILLDEGLIKA